ncbi:MAG: cupin [Pseudomonadota bacterium]
MTSRLHSIALPDAIVTPAPDGSEVHELARDERASMAIFRLPGHGVSRAVRHRSVSDYWFVYSGDGEIWRRLGDDEQNTPLRPGVSLIIPSGTAFQFRAGALDLEIVATTVPGWDTIDADGEVEFVAGPWQPG